MDASEVVIFNSTCPPNDEQGGLLAAVMPPLAGAPLEAPLFHRTRWRAGQRFSEEDDPDRMTMPWEPPSFACEEDPVSRYSLTRAEELPVPRAQPKCRFASVVRNVLSEEQCAKLLACVNHKGFTPALVNVGRGVQKLQPDYRDGHRIIVDSPQLATWLFEVLRPHLPEELENGARLVELNERLRFLCYTPGQSFEEHCDGRYRRPMGHPREGDFSCVTVQLYLHDVPEMHGGATTFFPGRSEAVVQQPEAGSALLFTQDLSHEGSIVKRGLKYTLRTEVMYTRSQGEVPQVRWSRCAPSLGSGSDLKNSASEDEGEGGAPTGAEDGHDALVR